LDKLPLLSYIEPKEGGGAMRHAVARKGFKRAFKMLNPSAFKSPPVPQHTSIAAGMRAFFAVAEKWGLSYEEAKTLLGQPGKTTFYNWKRGDVREVVHPMDLGTRISYLLGIFKALEIIYDQPELADTWVRRPNDAFGGQSALDRMLAGQIIDLARVREYLDSVRA
jgi:hypothetical protein